MAVLGSTELKKGAVFQQDEKTFKVLDYKHVKKGRGLATIRVKVRDVESGAITEKTFSSNEKVESAQIVYKSAQFLYMNEDKAYFMDVNDYSQFEIPLSDIEWESNFLVEGLKVKTSWLEEKVIGIELPKKVTIEVEETGPGVAGDTATSAMKEAELETGYKIQVPLFIENDDKLVVNTDSGDYVSKG